MATTVLRKLFLSNLKLPTNRCLSSDIKIGDDPLVVVTDDASTIVCWHPEKSFPYEMSLPIPEKPAEQMGALKVQSSRELMSIYKTKSEMEHKRDLAALTYTAYHSWSQRVRNRYKAQLKPKPEAPRRYL